ncbi:HAD-IA family hydrolase [Vibrio sp. WXL210]|uniref:HAD-IA family hydrolase n=1 Tax=Vibrio sp. WXL210 TaxID=3450709 RepID=UPI003EC5043C
MSEQAIKCVIFDCDGTLIDSEKLCLQAICITMEELGIQIEYQWVKESFQGIHINVVFNAILDQHRPDHEYDVEALIRRYRENCNTLFEQYLEPIEGVREVIETLKQRGIAMCIASNAPQEKMAITLAITDLEKDFSGRIYSAFDAQSWKPEPGLLYYVMDKMGYQADECLFIDDSMAGVEAGVRAKMRTLYFAHDALTHDNPFKSPTIHRLVECLDFLD